MTPAQQQNQKALELLELVARFGSLTSPLAARALHTEIKATSAQRQTQRLIKALAEKGLILTKRATKFEPMEITLSEKGARTLRAHGIHAKTGKDISAGRHRRAINEALIKALEEGWQVFTEYEILTGKAPCRELGGKVPDGLLYKNTGTGMTSTYWLEVEASPRGGRDLAKLCDWIVATLPNRWTGEYKYLVKEDEELTITKCLFVLAVKSAEKLESRIRAKLGKMKLELAVEDYMTNLIFYTTQIKSHVQILDTKARMDNK